MDKKTEKMIFRVTKEEKDKITELAHKKHLNVASYIRYQCLNTSENDEN